mgnify:FL=1
MSLKGNAGRLLPFKVHPPSTDKPFITVNTYMPTAGDTSTTRDDLESEIRTNHNKARTENLNFIAHGNMNATTHYITQRSGYSTDNTINRELDKRFHTFCTKQGLTSAPTDHTWWSHDMHKSAKLDHALHWPATWPCTTTTHTPTDSIADHDILLTTLPLSSGILPNFITTSPKQRIRTDARTALTALWQEAVERRLQAEPNLTLNRAQEIAIEEATLIYGLTSPKPKHDTRSATLKHIHNTITLLRHVRRRIYAVLHTHTLHDTAERVKLREAAQRIIEPVSYTHLTLPTTPYV